MSTYLDVTCWHDCNRLMGPQAQVSSQGTPEGGRAGHAVSAPGTAHASPGRRSPDHYTLGISVFKEKQFTKWAKIRFKKS